jgi:NodT family efflux transporter outer membrane factor (OMF) lipoprotein
MKNRQAILFLITVALAGCAVGPDYHPPKTQAPTNWSEAQLGGTTNTAVAIVEWWKTFNDPELNSLIERAAVANYDLRIADGRLHQARALRLGAVSDLGPTVNGSAGYTDARQSKNSIPFNTSGPGGAAISSNYLFQTDLYDVHFDASWEIDVFGGKRRALQQANAMVASAQEDRRDILVSVLAEVARNYIELRNFQQRIAITQKNITAQQDAVDIARSRFKAGLSSELDAKQAEAILATTQAQLPSLETSLKQCAHRLGVLIGKEPGALLVELSPTAAIPPPPAEVPVGLPSDLLRRRPDVRRAERELAASTANIGVQTAELFPKFTLTGVAGFQSFAVSDWFSGGSKYWSAGPTVTWRILDFGHVRSQIQAAKAGSQQSMAIYEKTVLTSCEDVENALVAYANEQVRYHALGDAVAANRASLEFANDRYNKGLADFLNVLDAERSLYQTEDQLADSQGIVSVNLVSLYKALGGGWPALEQHADASPTNRPPR